MIRGAYVGTLYPGRTSSRLEQIRRDAGVNSRPSADYPGASKFVQSEVQGDVDVA